MDTPAPATGNLCLVVGYDGSAPGITAGWLWPMPLMVTGAARVLAPTAPDLLR